MRYDRTRAVGYARRSALDDLNREYRCGTDADATAFVSRCVSEGLSVKLDYTDAESFSRALRKLHIARDCAPEELEPGDVVQIRAPGKPFHSLLVTGKAYGELLVAAHSYVSCDRPITSYQMADAIYLKISG